MNVWELEKGGVANIDTLDSCRSLSLEDLLLHLIRASDLATRSAIASSSPARPAALRAAKPSHAFVPSLAATAATPRERAYEPIGTVLFVRRDSALAGMRSQSLWLNTHLDTEVVCQRVRLMQ